MAGFTCFGIDRDPAAVAQVQALAARLAPELPPPVPAGAPRTTDLREVVNAILYRLHNGCAWHALPHDLPPEGTVRDYFHRWRRCGLWAKINDAFTKARQLMLSGDYDAAESAFSGYVATYPDTPKTPEARYWWGKTLMVRGDSAKAASAFIGAIRGWPQTAWAPDAVVELSRSLAALKKPADACQTLAELDRKYPKAPASVKTRAAAVRAQAKCG